ncbi:looped-hinge helix DNA binding domain, AbrB family [Geoglobus ahangari]|uniref:Looped-hinge helix DNA binding domain, AbrB family n=2 Tax=Geoglobus ahangari TaxID=113653 RepID=A0A0F7IF05_9EURY|nr:looped-hinge helix DNA binding domain, AbrB family [Geoglobus ahangari]
MVPEYLKEMQKLWNDLLKMQGDFMQNISSMLGFASEMHVFRKDIAVFRARVQSGGRISIPESDRAMLGLKEGDIVKVIVVKEGGEE